MKNINTRCTIAMMLLCFLGFAGGASATVIPVGDGNYEVSYGINMTPGSSNGSDVESVFFFEWDDSNYSNFSVEYAGTIAATGNTYLSHVIDFEPSYALLIGYGAAVPGVGDEKDHLYTITNSGFLDIAMGKKWSEVFPGTESSSRVSHSAMIAALIAAQPSDGQSDSLNALSILTDFIKNEGYIAAFNPDQSFVVVEWSNAGPGGGSIPEPSTLALLGLGLAGLSFARRKKV